MMFMKTTPLIVGGCKLCEDALRCRIGYVSVLPLLPESSLSTCVQAVVGQEYFLLNIFFFLLVEKMYNGCITVSLTYHALICIISFLSVKTHHSRCSFQQWNVPSAPPQIHPCLIVRRFFSWAEFQALSCVICQHVKNVFLFCRYKLCNGDRRTGRKSINYIDIFLLFIHKPIKDLLIGSRVCGSSCLLVSGLGSGDAGWAWIERNVGDPGVSDDQSESQLLWLRASV